MSETIDVRFKKPHGINGTRYKAGEVATVPASCLPFMQRKGIAEVLPGGGSAAAEELPTRAPGIDEALLEETE